MQQEIQYFELMNSKNNSNTNKNQNKQNHDEWRTKTDRVSEDEEITHLTNKMKET